VSGVVFAVKETSPRRDVAGQPLYFCCEACAAYFSQNPERVLALRRASQTK
jgi:YHS domain-containing protein